MNTFIKDFVKWFLVKTNIDSRIYNPPLFKEGQIWWCSIGENVGGEISGKGEYFRRPVLIIRKLDRFSFIGLPITSQIKTGSWYFNLKVNKPWQVLNHATASGQLYLAPVLLEQLVWMDRLGEVMLKVDNKNIEGSLLLK